MIFRLMLIKMGFGSVEANYDFRTDELGMFRARFCSRCGLDYVERKRR